MPTASTPTQSPASPARGRGWARLHRRATGAGAGNGAPGTSEGFDGGLDHSTLVIAGVTTLGLIMAVLDTIVNVALDTLARDVHSSRTGPRRGPHELSERHDRVEPKATNRQIG